MSERTGAQRRAAQGRRAATAMLGAALLTACAPGGGTRAAAEAIRAAHQPRPAPPPPANFRTPARNAVLYDFDRGAALAAKAPDAAIPPASMTKLMTLLIAFEALDGDEIGGGDRIRVSQRAAARGGSRLGLSQGQSVRLDELIAGVAIASGNDAATALAEAIAGGEAAFAERMTARAQELGWSSAAFRNATGLPQRGHRISVGDLAALGAHLWSAHAPRLGVLARRSVIWNGVTRFNRHPLLGADLSEEIGRGARVDGMKTGHTREAGYCIVLSATRDGRRAIIVLAGLPSETARAAESRRALAWAYRRMAADAAADAEGRTGG